MFPVLNVKMILIFINILTKVVKSYHTRKVFGLFFFTKSKFCDRAIFCFQNACRVPFIY